MKRQYNYFVTHKLFPMWMAPMDYWDKPARGRLFYGNTVTRFASREEAKRAILRTIQRIQETAPYDKLCVESLYRVWRLVPEIAASQTPSP